MTDPFVEGMLGECNAAKKKRHGESADEGKPAKKTKAEANPAADETKPAKKTKAKGNAAADAKEPHAEGNAAADAAKPEGSASLRQQMRKQVSKGKSEEQDSVSNKQLPKRMPHAEWLKDPENLKLLEGLPKECHPPNAPHGRYHIETYPILESLFNIASLKDLQTHLASIMDLNIDSLF